MDRSKQMETSTSLAHTDHQWRATGAHCRRFAPMGVSSLNVLHRPHSARARRPTTTATTNMTDKNSTVRLKMRKGDQREACEN